MRGNGVFLMLLTPLHPSQTRGAEGNAPTTTDAADPRYPETLADMASQVGAVVSKYKLKEILGLGVGNGGYILAKYAAENPKVS
jgi:pimeloyl-ACP methyl ester carboxylesterase